MMKKNIIILILLPFLSIGQGTYYKMPNGKIIDSLTLKSVKENLSTKGNIEERIISTENRNDSIIKTIKITINTIDNGNNFNPYSKFEKLIGTKFLIDRFENNGIKINKDKFNSRPTFINFWFTNCAPCIEEIPKLNKLKEQFGDKVNFIAITFDSKEKVEKFLKTINLEFNHITDSKKVLEELEIQAYPMNYILDKEGKILNVYGDISYSEKEIIEILNNLL